MKSLLVLASVASAAAATRGYAGRSQVARATDSTDCIPENFTVSNFVAAGAKTTNLTALAFNFFDPHTGLATTCELNSTSTNLTPEGTYANYKCDSSLLKFQWGIDKAVGQYLLGVSETICSNELSTADSWLPSLSCQNHTTGTGIECRFAGNNSYTADFSGAPQPIV